MVLDTTRANLAREVMEAEDFRDEFLEAWDRMVGSYHGPHYYKRGHDHPSSPENRYFEVVQMLLSRLVHDNPRVRARSRRTTDDHMQLAEAIQHGLNRWIVDYNLKYALESIALDYLFGWGVGMVRTEPRKGTAGWNINAPDEEATWPILEHISPKLYFHDPQATRWSEIRFQGHVWYDDQENLLELAEDDETWNPDEIKKLAEDAGLDKLERDPKDRATRREIVGYEVWVPECELDEFPDGSPPPEGGWRANGYHGCIFTLAHCDAGGSRNAEDTRKKARFIREPRPYFGSRHGPYVVWGAFEVPGKTYPLGLFTAVEEEIRDLNDTALVHKARNRRHKRGIALPQTAAAEAKKIQQGKDDEIILLPVGDNGQMVKPEAYEVGGTTQEDMLGYEYKGARLDRMLLGMSESHQGSVQGGTATEVAVADQAFNARLAVLDRNWNRGVEEVLERAGEAMYRDEDIVFPLGGEAAEQMGLAPEPLVGALGVPIPGPDGRPMMRQPDPWFVGGSSDKLDEDSGASWEALEIEIEPYSMGYVDQAAQQRQVVELVQLIIGLAPVLREFPEIDGQQVFKMIAAAWNNPAVAKLIDPKMAQQTMGRPVGQHPEQPRFRSDAGRVGLRGGGNAGPALIQQTVGALAGQQRGQQVRQTRGVG